MPLSAEARLARARMMLEGRGLADASLLPPVIVESWARCLDVGLDPRTPPPLARIDDSALARERERAGRLRDLVLAEMKQVYQQIAGTNYMVAFASPDGLLLDTIADPSFSAAARAASIAPGTLWEEARCGTNALGTTARTGAPVTVHGGEHFFARHGGLTCTAVPVFDPDGTLAGVLDASSDYRSRQEHTRALVAMAATQIENGLLRERHAKHMLVAFHSRAEYLHTLSAGLLAVDADGRILAANAQARFLLHGLPATRGRHFDDVFRTRLSDLLGAGRADRQQVEDRVGSVFATRLENPPARSFAVLLPQPPAPAIGPQPDFVADDPAVAAIVRQVAAAARRGVPILIRGATGTGKEQLARHAHLASRRQGRFVPVNCAALPETLAEAELFGHAEGAFTGARRGGAPGLIAEADGGTLFLDEIGDMKPALQALLLRFLDDWTVRPVGGARQKRVDVQLVAATNMDLQPAIAAGRFRADLFYRIATLEVALPPLAVRGDLAAIARRVMADIAPDVTVPDETIAVLAAHGWPGNIRELRGVLTRATLEGEQGAVTPEAVAALLGRAAERGGPAAGDGLRDAVRERIARMHRDMAGNVSATARRLKVSRNTVYRALRPGGER